MSNGLTVVALGGHALQPRSSGDSSAARADIDPARVAATVSALLPIARAGRLLVTHGNGPQIGLLAMRSGGQVPLAVLGAETEGMIGHLLELELRRQTRQEVATLLTQVRVDRFDPAFETPTKPIGPPLDEAGRRLAAERGWTLTGEGERVRRIVASPRPLEVLSANAIRRLVEDGVVVIAGGGGGIPVAADDDGRLDGVEAVVDKDAVSALLARQLDARVLVLLTDVDAVWADWGTDRARRLERTTPEELRALALDPGSMGAKVEAAARFVEETGGRAAIGALDEVEAVVAGTAGTQVRR